MSSTPTPGTPTESPEPAPEQSKNGWMPVTAGILTIIGGTLVFFRGLARESRMGFFPGLGVFLGIMYIIVAILAIVGGIFAVQKKGWGMSLLGGICARFPPATVLGILAIVFIAVGKNEFKK
jgi:hypothetical protein